MKRHQMTIKKNRYSSENQEKYTKMTVKINKYIKIIHQFIILFKKHRNYISSLRTFRRRRAIFFFDKFSHDVTYGLSMVSQATKNLLLHLSSFLDNLV